MPGLQKVFKNFDLSVIVVLFFSKDKEFFIKHKFSKFPTSIPNKLFSPYHFSISTMINLLIMKVYFSIPTGKLFIVLEIVLYRYSS